MAHACQSKWKEWEGIWRPGSPTLLFCKKKNKNKEKVKERGEGTGSNLLIAPKCSDKMGLQHTSLKSWLQNSIYVCLPFIKLSLVAVWTVANKDRLLIWMIRWEAEDSAASGWRALTWVFSYLLSRKRMRVDSNTFKAKDNCYQSCTLPASVGSSVYTTNAISCL